MSKTVAKTPSSSLLLPPPPPVVIAQFPPPIAPERARNVRVTNLSPNRRPVTPLFPHAIFRTDKNLPGASKLKESTIEESHVIRAGKRPAEVIDLTATTEGIEIFSSQSPKRIKTTATEAKLRKAKKERADQHEKMTAESVTWRRRYKKAFPSFVFYFDALDPATELSQIKSVERLGATVDNFFSKKVTHVVTSRSVPSAATGKENSGSFSKATTNESMAGPTRTTRSNRQSPVNYSYMNGQKIAQHDALEKNPFIDAQDILSKASEFGLKIWKIDKAQRIIARINSYSPNKVDNPIPHRLSLPSLLRDEQLFGTRERDPFVPRADTHYFPPKSNYVLVEDSTGEHRPIVTKEYGKPRKGEDPSWPVLWGGVEGRGGFYHYQGAPIVHRARVPPKPELMKPKPEVSFYRAAAVNNVAGPSLRRAISMNHLNKQANSHLINHKNEAYIVASGNSQTITSNIASATSTRSGAHAQLGVKGFVDKRLAVLSRSTIVLGGAKGILKRSASVDAGLNKKAPPAREEPKKPGYCENCRLKYDDFKEHVLARRHRKFAKNDANWLELDCLLRQIQRPLLHPECAVGDDSGYGEAMSEEEEEIDEMNESVDESVDEEEEEENEDEENEEEENEEEENEEEENDEEEDC